MNCAVCGEACKPPFRAPAAELAPDLDGRPGEPARSTLRRWVQTCRKCGAVAPDLSTLPEAAADIMTHPEYWEEADPFLRWALLAPGEPAAEAVLQAAWLADDDGTDATALRLRAASLWQGDPLRRVDILRRAGAFEAALALLGGLQRPDEAGRAIIDFQRRRIEAGDTGRHLLSSALRPPARSPHVTHGKKAGKSLFGRLFGG